MEEFGGEGAGEGFNGFALGWGEIGEPFGGAGQLGFADGLGVLLEDEDGGDCIAGLETLLVLGYFLGDDVLGCSGLAAAIGEVDGGYLLEVVNVVDEAAFDVVHFGIDVARNGDVDEEHGTVAAAVEELLAVGPGEDVLRGSGAGDDDVGAVGLLVEGVEGDDGGVAAGAVEEVGNLLGAGLGAVGDEDGGCTLLNEMAGGQL